jgi:hypothetical protein
MNRDKVKRGYVACMQLPDGSYSDDEIHELMTAGVDDYDCRLQTRRRLIAAGVPIADMDRLIPEKISKHK